MEGRLIWTAMEILRAGADVILDFGFWGRDERASLHWLASTVCAATRTEYIPVNRETQTERVAKRWAETPEQTWRITQEELDQWRPLFQEPDRDELAGRYTTPAPPEGWRTWIATRWPSSIQGPL